MPDAGLFGESVLVLLGPTATGKSAIAIEVAKRIGGEILSADSRAFFRGLEIVAAVPTAQERAGIPHHLVGNVGTHQSYDAMAFRRDVEVLIPEIRRRGGIPILVGGGTLYLGSLLRGIFEGPSKDPSFRNDLADTPTDRLHARLTVVDPDAATAIHVNDRLRIERALEVFEQSGRPISQWQADAVPLSYPLVVFGLERERDEHRAAIRSRVQAMLDAGLIAEVEQLRADGLAGENQAYRTIGIPEVSAYLDGASTKEEMIEAMVTQTWSLAKRQRAWFRRDRDVTWLDVTGRTVAVLADAIVGQWRERTP